MGSDRKGQRGEGEREVGPGDGNVVEGAGADVGSEGSGEEQDQTNRGEGNLIRAAERLFVSQPALTKQIRQLENQLSMRLSPGPVPG